MQQIQFVTQAIAALFHDSPREFLFYLERDGNDFLRFYWDKVGDDVKEHKNFAGMGYEFRNGNAFIKLPQPTEIGEAYYIALLYKQNLLFSTTRVFVLEYTKDIPLLVEITKRLKRIVVKKCDTKEFFNCIAGGTNDRYEKRK